jgi:hypothetical protein
MNDRMRALKGSPLRDLFKQLHKEMLPGHMTGCDLDFMIVEKNPDCIAAFVDFKKVGERLTYAEAIAYNELLRVAPLYLIYAAGETAIKGGQFEMWQFLSADRGPDIPAVEKVFCARSANWTEYGHWEQSLRAASKKNGKA